MKKLLIEVIRNIILEYTPQKGVTLYHRSYHKFNVGDTIKPGIDSKTGKPHRSDKAVELAMESYRSKKHPELPSRFNSVYLSYLPRSRFLSKGHLYAVKLVPGPTLTTDSRIIDKLNDRYRGEYDDYDRKFREPYVYENDSLIEEYWEGVEPTRDNLKDIEVLAPAAIVTEVIEENRLIRGTQFEFGNVTIMSSINSYVRESTGEEYTYASDGNKEVSIKDALDSLKNIPGLTLGDVEPNHNKTSKKYDVKLSSHFRGKVITAMRPDPGQKGLSYSRISLAPEKANVALSLDSKEGFKFLTAFRKGLIKKV